MRNRLFTVLALALSAGCSMQAPPRAQDLPREPLYKQTVAQIGDELGELQVREPDFHARTIELARKNVGQPYELYLLGEAPFEEIDRQPVYNLRKSDCVVFVEHTLAMAMSDRFSDFLRHLQRIRYAGGVIGVETRNHFTEADWNVNNAWLLADITSDVAGDAVVHYTSKVDRAAFFKKRYKLVTTYPVERVKVAYVPFDQLAAVKPKLKTGDVIEFIKGTAADSAWVHHLGFVAVMPDGAVHVIHSATPRVREEPIEAYVARALKNKDKLDAAKKPRHRGFKFLRPVDDPVAALKAVDGANAPRVVVPANSAVDFETFIDDVLAGRR